ncbi:partial Cation efflux system protein CusB, partial [uncultured bacterium]
MSAETNAKVRGGRSMSLVVLPVVAAGGIYIGMRWHTLFERWLVPSAVMAPGAGRTRADEGATNPTDQAVGAKQLWTCGMHPQVIQEQPGDCPICHMKLTPLAASTADAPAGAGASSGAVVIDPAVVQNMGVRTVTVSRGTLSRHIRATATIVEPESGRTDINLRVSGWIQKLHADTDGMAVRKGDPLFDLYSPELRQAIEEFIAARHAVASIVPESSGATDAPVSAAASLVVAAESRLLTLGLTPEQVAQV